MKALTILEPWASLIACGAKKIETRSWRTNYRGKIAIHAAAKHTKLQFKEPYHDALSKYYNLHVPYSADEMPYGCVIAIADLVDCLQVVDSYVGLVPGGVISKKAYLSDRRVIFGNELIFGNYPVGGYAWILENIQRIEPVPAKGQQGLWNWEGGQ